MGWKNLGMVLVASILATTIVIPAGAEDRDANFQRAWQRWLEASRNETHIYSGDVVQDARIGALLGSEGSKEVKVFDLKVGATTSMGCVGNDPFMSADLYASMINEMASLMADADQILASLVADAPGLALAYFKPEWAKAVKYFRRFTHQLMNFRANQCQALNKLIAKRMADVASMQKQKCIEALGGGHSAMDECSKEVLKEDPFRFFPSMPNTNNGSMEYRPVEYALTKAFENRGLNEKEANDRARIVTGFFGDLFFRHGTEGLQGRRGEGVSEGIQRLYSDKIGQWRRRAEALAKNPSKEEAKAFATHLTRVTPAQVALLTNSLGREATKSILFKLAQINAKLETLYAFRGYQDLYATVTAGNETESVKDKVRSTETAMSEASRIILGSEEELSAEYRKLLEESLRDALAKTRDADDRGVDEAMDRGMFSVIP